MIPIRHGNVVSLVSESARVADLIKQNGKALVWKRQPAARRSTADKALSVADSMNARREAEYVARRNGQKAALIQLFKVPET